MKKLKFKHAYEILKKTISRGIKHSDIFYLFGECCRVLNLYEDGEKYLLDALRFEQHSPYVYYSAGLLYQEIQDYKKSVSLFKHFLTIMENADTHYQISKSYVGLQNYLEALSHISSAIGINPNCIEYYNFRSELYEVMGFHEMSKDDLVLVKKLEVFYKWCDCLFLVLIVYIYIAYYIL